MSIKRTKQRSFSRDKDGDPTGFGPPKVIEPEKTWAEQIEGKPDDAFAPYAMTAKYEKGALIAHSKFGKGVVLNIEGPRAEVLFADGPKKLGHVG